MFAGFQKDQRQVNGVQIAYRIGGNGPGLLLLHGHPQTHVIWHKVVERLSPISPSLQPTCAAMATAASLRPLTIIAVIRSGKWAATWWR